ncbi:MAG TPA: nitroreductase family protein [Chloroflexota bacterium]|nr:nitroreductase family protein [Chloroflexota bacterium]
MDRVTFLRRVRQVRDFRPAPVPDDALADILEVGRWSGSASNRQTSEVVVVRDPEVRQQLTAGGANTAARAAVALVIVTLGDPAREELEVFDEGRMSERLLLAAAAHGLGASITTLKGEGPAVAKQALGIPAERRVKTVVAVGVADDAAIRAKPKNPQPRKPINEFAHWDHY